MSDTATSSEHHLVVDSLTEGLARLVLYGNDHIYFDCPVALLPAGLREGDHLRLTLTRDDVARLQEQAEVKNLLRELTQGSDPDQKDFYL
ncbi:MAG: DUF3006 domain-containing protein [Chloracidobacterium sp.]|uniref:DUF3006 domain-containing protein n=1 Tax=Chloracidobacterium validum TaxID=2821543 RepID=A0ABX8B6N8_9BACT|nr:DUF3006 domain-containing protein [Chloracidobacterium validum]QUW02102.1 hypothetical protein J8C06_06935 [Chloracidobacterium validum]